MSSEVSPDDLAKIRKRARILVIDDKADAFPVDAMKQRGYNVDYWPDITAECLHRLEKGDYDIIILDIRGVGTQISREEGFGVLKRLKDVNPALTVVAFSGASFDIGESEFFKLADDVLQKPADLFTCEDKINALLANSFGFLQLWEAVDVLLKSAGAGKWRRGRLKSALKKALDKQRGIEGVGERIRNLIPSTKDLEIALSLLNLIARLYSR
jgi:DNA-binding response OmpR family regulator